MTDKPNIELLNELVGSPYWQALKQEISVCITNSLVRLKREGEVNRDYQAGMVTAYENILFFENKYKNIDLTKAKNESNN